MSVTNQDCLWTYTGDGTTTAFAFDNVIYAATDLIVSVAGAVQTLTTDYAVSGIGAGGGGSVTFVTAPPDGDEVLIQSAIPATQQVSLAAGTPFPSAAIATALDRLTRLAQQAGAPNALALLFPTSDPQGIGHVLPAVASRALQLLGFDADGNPIAVQPSEAPVSSALQPFVAATTLAAAAALLEIAPGNIDYTASGAGAVSRTLQAKLADAISVLDFGAVGDGATDDHAAIAAAFTAANGKKRVLFPGLNPAGNAATYHLGVAVAAPAQSYGLAEAGATFTGSTLSGVMLESDRAQAAGTAGSVMKIDKLWEANTGTERAITLGGLWSGLTYSAAGFSKEFEAGDGAAGSPCVALLSLASDNGSPADVVSQMAVAMALTSSAAVWGGNDVAASAAGLVTVKLVGREIDVEPAAGVTCANGAGLFINAFNVGTGLGAAVQLGGIGGGKFDNGIMSGGIKSAGSAFAVLGGTSCYNGIDLSQGTYGNASILIPGGVPGIAIRGNGTTLAVDLYGDTGNNFNVSLQAAAMLVETYSTTDGVEIAEFRTSAGTSAVRTYVASGTAANAAGCALWVRANTSTSRAINAGGTINASGADYAEYERRRPDCAPIAKGALVGFDSDGLLTDRFSRSIRFGVRSTAPNLVGGDDWHIAIGEPPVAPLAPMPPRDAPVKPQTIRTVHQPALDAEHDAAMAAWRTAVDQHATDLATHHTAMAAHDAAMAAWRTAFAAAESAVEQIAYCGKVPIAVTGGQPGWYVVPIAGADDAITAIFVAEDDMNLAHYLRSVGRVNRVLPDGRSEIVVRAS